MLQKIKKRAVQATLIAIALAVVFFINVGSPEQLKSYLLNETEQLWGQAYSPNVGWINFYCDGVGGAKPATAPAGKGASVMPNFCDTTAYGATLDSSTKTFSGEAYSSNYGWLDLNGLTMDASSKLHGSTDGSALGDYNFGTTYFKKNDPNNNNPGVNYYNNLGYLCGFAYSDAVGYISFCDPQTKEKSPKDISVSGFDFDTYAVYLGIGDSDDPIPPILTTPSKVFAATDDYDEILWFQDEIGDIVSVKVVIFDSNGAKQTYNADYFDPENNRASVSITNHNFHLVGDYDLTFTACDAIGNCTNPTIENDGLYSGFFKVVAAAPDWLGYNSCFEFGSSPKVADGQENHFVRTTLIDIYGNPVISVAGIKEVSVNTKFENTTELDQVDTGKPAGDDSAVFEASEFGFSRAGGTSTGFLIEADDGDGKFKVDTKSFAPTSNGYAPIASDGFNLFFDEITYNVAALDSYTNVGESSGTYSSTDENREFAFSPTLVVTPEALIWDGNYYILDTSAAENITVNAPKRFNLELQNFSSGILADSPELGLLLDSDDNNITWTDTATEDPSPPEIILDLDINQSDGFDSSWNSVSGLIGSVGVITKNIRMRVTPELAPAATAPTNFGTLFEAYASYEIAGKRVRHRSEKLELGGGGGGICGDGTQDLGEECDDGNTVSGDGCSDSCDLEGGGGGICGDGTQDLGEECDDGNTVSGDGCSDSCDVETQQLFNPGIEIIGSVFSSGGTSSKQAGDVLNQSLGDLAQNELETLINRNTAALTKNPNVSGCAGDELTNFATFATDNPSCAHFESNVLYFEGDVILNLSGNLPSGAKTILIEGGNLYVKNNFVYPIGAGNSFGVIVLKNAAGVGGNIFVYPNVTNVAGAFYAEGSVISVNAEGECGEDATVDCSGTGFCDRSFELRDQLYWKGLIATQNTIGGADTVPLTFPSSVDIAANCPPPSCASAPTPSCSREAARLYDFAYLRTFHPDSGGTQVFADSDAALVVKYDSRIQNNPPPLFESVEGSSSQLEN